jgi:hypothetical protein
MATFFSRIPASMRAATLQNDMRRNARNRQRGLPLEHRARDTASVLGRLDS